MPLDMKIWCRLDLLLERASHRLKRKREVVVVRDQSQKVRVKEAHYHLLRQMLRNLKSLLLSDRNLFLCNSVRSTIRTSLDEADTSFETHEKDELLYEDKTVNL
jgi:hypothetical protein